MEECFMALIHNLQKDRIEAGCDEAGRGCLAGPVVAAAVVLPNDFRCAELDDSKKLTEKKRYALREIITKEAVAWAVGICSPEEIDEINILKASFLAMHKALNQLPAVPDFILVDGNRFTPYKNVPHECFVKGDGRFLSIAAASVLAKTYRDDLMIKLHDEFPQYKWNKNKGYPTKEHRQAIEKYGSCLRHRKSFSLLPQLRIPFE